MLFRSPPPSRRLHLPRAQPGSGTGDAASGQFAGRWIPSGRRADASRTARNSPDTARPQEARETEKGEKPEEQGEMAAWRCFPRGVVSTDHFMIHPTGRIMRTFAAPTCYARENRGSRAERAGGVIFQARRQGVARTPPRNSSAGRTCPPPCAAGRLHTG